MHEYNWKRARNFLWVGMLFIGPFLHLNYTHVLPYIAPKVNLYGTITKLFFDQIIAAPTFFFCFYHALNLIDEKSLHEANTDI